MCSHQPFDTKNKIQGGGQSKGGSQAIDVSDEVQLQNPSDKLSGVGGGQVSSAIGGLQDASSGGASTSFRQPDAAPSAMDNFVGLAADPKGQMAKAAVKGWKDGVAINTAENGGKLGFLDTLGAGVSGAGGGVKRQFQGAFSSAASQDNQNFSQQADAARATNNGMGAQLAANAAKEAAAKAAADAAAKAAAEQAAAASASTAAAGTSASASTAAAGGF